MGDAELVCRARAGDRDAFAELVLRHAATARRLAARMLGDDELARDVVQEAAVLALVSLDRLANPDRFGPWLCGIALNVARRWLRETRPFDEVAVEPADPAPGPDEFAEERDIAGRVRRAVATLAPGQRDAVLLFYLQGLAHREVAAELGISVGAVKARLHQARAALGRKLGAVRSEPASGAGGIVRSEPGSGAGGIVRSEPGSGAGGIVRSEPASGAGGIVRSEPASGANSTEVPIDKGKSMTEWVPVTVAEVRASDEERERRPHVVVLAERDGQRKLAIWIGPAEATALAMSLDNVEMPRPATYQFAKSLVEAAGGTVSEVRITRLSERPPVGHALYYAVVIVNGQEVDSRPSDAVNLALVADVPILVNPEIFGAADEDLLSKYPLSTEDIADKVRAQFP